MAQAIFAKSALEIDSTYMYVMCALHIRVVRSYNKLFILFSEPKPLSTLVCIHWSNVKR